MPTYVRIAEPKMFRMVEPKVILLQRLLGAPLAVSAIALLLIALSARYNVPLGTFDPQNLLAPF